MSFNIAFLSLQLYSQTFGIDLNQVICLFAQCLLFVCICSIKDVSGTGLILYRQINDSDILTLLEMRDPMEIAQHTVDRIRSDFSKISCIYSVNCIFRYLVLKDRGELNTYLAKIASLGPSCGLVGFGEHYNTQFVNQTMTCVVFE